MGRKVISPKQLPIRPPIIGGCVTWLMLDRLHAPGWLYGVLATLYLILALACIYDMCSRNVKEIEL